MWHQCNEKDADSDQGLHLMIRANITIGGNVISVTLTMALLLVPDGLMMNISETANLLGFSHTNVCAYTESPVRYGSDGPC